MIDTLWATIFWTCVVLMLHTFVLYPYTLKLFRKKYVDPPRMADHAWPKVAVMVPAYNEESVIGEKVRNCLDQDYPADKLQILIGSDGSQDRTDEIVESIQDSRVKLIRLGGRNGKPMVLNQLVELSGDADVVVISDANIIWDSQALKMACRHFADPKVGVVSGGRYALTEEGDELAAEEQFYTTHENNLKTLEAQIGGMSGGMGMLLAIRRELYRPFVPGSANDDVVPMLWATSSGYRSMWEMNAMSYERAGQSFREEFRRRIRIGVGNFQTLFRYVSVLSPRFGISAYTYFSHKVIRWVFPFLMIFALTANLMIWERPLYELTLIVQLVLYIAALVGGIAVMFGMRVPPITSLFHFVAMNVALLLGFLRYLKMGKGRFVWEPTART